MIQDCRVLVVNDSAVHLFNGKEREILHLLSYSKTKSLYHGVFQDNNCESTRN